MNEVRIAILCPLSSGESFVAQQLTNYQSFLGPQDVHFLHISKGFDFNKDVLLSGAIDSEVVFAEQRFPTSRKCTFGAHISNTLELLKRRSEFTHVYIHTDADLLIKGNLRDEITKCNLAFSRGAANPLWRHYGSMINDTSFTRIRKRLGIDDSELKVGRQEGSFFPICLWEAAFETILDYYTDEHFIDESLYWPIEECLIPTVINHLSRRYNIACTRNNIVLTKTPQLKVPGVNPREVRENCVTVADIQALICDSSLSTAGIKWFYKDENDPARIFVKRLLSKNSSTSSA